MYNAIYLEDGKLNCEDFPTLDSCLQLLCYPNIQILSIEEASSEIPDELQDAYEEYLAYWMNCEEGGC